MRTICDDKGSFMTRGNTNGVYGRMERDVSDLSSKSAVAKTRFNRKPWYLECLVGSKLIPMEGVVSINKEIKDDDSTEEI